MDVLNGLFFHKYKKRNEWIDVARGISIIIIIYAHIFNNYNSSYITDFVHLFHVPVFFFISGLVWKRKSFSNIARNLFNRLLIPYFFASVISILIFQMLARFLQGVNIGMLKCLLGMVYANSRTGYMKWNRPLWFIPCLIVVRLLWEGITRISNAKIRCVTVISMWICGMICLQYFNNLYLPWEMEISFHMLPFFCLGAITKPEWISKAVLKKKNAVFAAIMCFLICLGIFKLNRVDISVQNNEYGNYFLFLIGATAGTVLVLMVSNILSRMAVLQLIGQNSMLILLWHKFPVLLYQMTPIGKATMDNANSILSVTMAVIVIAISILCSFAVGMLMEKACCCINKKIVVKVR